MNILVIVALKGSCKRIEILEVLSLKGLWYGMVIDISHWEYPPPPLLGPRFGSIVQNWVWVYA